MQLGIGIPLIVNGDPTDACLRSPVEIKPLEGPMGGGGFVVKINLFQMIQSNLKQFWIEIRCILQGGDQMRSADFEQA